MNDNKIFKMSLVTTIIGLAGIIILSGFVSPENISIDKIDKSRIDNRVQIEAKIVSITQTKTNTKIIRLTDNTGSINLVIFPSLNFNHVLKVNQQVRVIAKVAQYNGNPELILEQSRNIIIL